MKPVYRLGLGGTPHNKGPHLRSNLQDITRTHFIWDTYVAELKKTAKRLEPRSGPTYVCPQNYTFFSKLLPKIGIFQTDADDFKNSYIVFQHSMG